MKIDMSHIKTGNSGDWSVEEFEASELWYRISLMKSGRGVPPGKYLRLKRGRTVVMSNTPDEIRDFSQFVWRAKGRILVNGLGLGCVLTALLDKPEITEVIVVEQSKDVINLISGSFNDSRLTIVHADAFEYTPTGRFDAVWHDIWDHITADNLQYMTKLHRKYARRTDWQDSWCKKQCQRLKRQEQLQY